MATLNHQLFIIEVALSGPAARDIVGSVDLQGLRPSKEKKRRTIARLPCKTLKQIKSGIALAFEAQFAEGAVAYLIHAANHEGARLSSLERLDRQIDRPEAPAEALISVRQVEGAVDWVRVS